MSCHIAINSWPIFAASSRVIVGSMVGSFPSGVCESSQCKGEGLTAHSVQYPGQSLGLLHTRLIVLDAQAPKDFHHRPFARGVKRAKGDVLSLRKQVLGLCHYVPHVYQGSTR